MNIRCKLVENYKLTLGKEYEVGAESQDFYTIINDNGVGVRYSKRLFDVVQEVVVPPPPPARTERDVLNSIRLNGDRVYFTNIENIELSVPVVLSLSNSGISCGVRQITQINRQIQVIDEHFDLEEDDFLNIRKALFRKTIENIQRRLHNNNAAFGVMSTNVTGQDEGHLADEDMLSVLDSMAHKTSDAMRNPNSDRNIKVWILTSIE